MIRPAGATTSLSRFRGRHRHNKRLHLTAAALGAHPIGLIVPCHRVVRTGGGPGGYGFGLDRKRWLLEHERSASERVAGSQPRIAEAGSEPRSALLGAAVRP